MTNIKDLAKLAGVSVTTVSRVLNNHPYVREEKRAAVLEAIETSNYQRNINAVHLSKGVTRLIGVVLPYSDHPYFSQLLKGIAQQALEKNYNLVLFQTDYMEEKEMEALQMLKQKQLDGLIICSRTCSLEQIEAYLTYGSISLCENTTESMISSTFVDHYQTFLHALTYLYEKGHQKIGYTLGRKNGPSSYQREKAYLDFHQQYGLPFNPSYTFDQCFYFEDGKKVTEQLLTMDTPPTALLVTSDQVAAGIIICCENHKLSIPNELSIIGFDNEPIAEIMNMTTIEIPLIEMGRNLFTQAIEKKSSHQEFPVKLIGRGTICSLSHTE